MTKTITIKDVSFQMVFVQGGSYLMGADNGVILVKKGWLTRKRETTPFVRNFDWLASDWEKPVHEVSVDSYYIGETVVTIELWEAVMGWGSAHSFERCPLQPVVNVDWVACHEFINRLNLLTGERFRLPREAEWEFAAKGGTLSKDYPYSGSTTAEVVAWFNENSDGVNPVCMKHPNELGLFDMSGNVWEWCEDKYAPYDSEPQVNPILMGTAVDDNVLRGGSYLCDSTDCRVSARTGSHSIFDKDDIHDDFGLRLVLPIS